MKAIAKIAEYHDDGTYLNIEWVTNSKDIPGGFLESNYTKDNRSIFRRKLVEELNIKSKDQILNTTFLISVYESQGRHMVRPENITTFDRRDKIRSSLPVELPITVIHNFKDPKVAAMSGVRGQNKIALQRLKDYASKVIERSERNDSTLTRSPHLIEATRKVINFIDEVFDNKQY